MTSSDKSSKVYLRVDDGTLVQFNGSHLQQGTNHRYDYMASYRVAGNVVQWSAAISLHGVVRSTRGDFEIHDNADQQAIEALIHNAIATKIDVPGT